MKHLLLFFIPVFLFFGCNNGKEEIEIPKEITHLNKTIQYKSLNDGTNANLLSLDIYYSDDIETLKPIVIYIHGGAWCIGDKINALDNKISLFRSLGYVFVSVNYRLSPFPYDVNDANRIKYPIHNIDIADAIKSVYNNIESFGGDKNKIALLGHSAGAHLVSLTGTNSHFLENVGLSLSVIKGVASIDTRGYDVREIVFNEKSEVYINAFGSDENENIAASPIHNIARGKVYPKFFIAKRGSASRIAFADDFITKLQDNGVTVSQVSTGNSYTHGGINDAIGKENETLITAPLKAFFENCFE